MTSRRGSLLGVSGGLLLLLTSCAPTTTEPPAPTTDSSAAPTEAATVLSCESLIRPALVKAFAETGFVSERSDFTLIDKTIKNGIMCLWVDREGEESTAQFFGWAPLSEEQIAHAQKQLLDTGWTKEEGRGGVYFTEDPEFALVTDDDGYGTTYFFRDGWVRMADTKQNLLVFDWPKS